MFRVDQVGIFFIHNHISIQQFRHFRYLWHLLSAEVAEDAEDAETAKDTKKCRRCRNCLKFPYPGEFFQGSSFFPKSDGHIKDVEKNMFHFKYAPIRTMFHFYELELIFI